MSENKVSLEEILRCKTDRKKTKKWRLISVLLVIFFIFIMSIQMTIYTTDNRSVAFKKYDHIAHIKIEGIIFNDRYLVELLEDIKDSDNIKGLIIEINTPGGGVVGAEVIYNAIKLIAKEKPVTTSVGTLATSAGYLIASATHKIYSHKTSIVGSIGVLMQWVEYNELLKALGINSQIVRSGKYKAFPNPMEATPDYVIKNLKNTTNELHKWFADIVMKERNFTKDKIVELSDGRVFTGISAVKLGLIDAIGGVKESIEWLDGKIGSSEDLDVVTYEPNYDSNSTDSFLKDILSLLHIDSFLSKWLGIDINAKEHPNINGPMFIWTPDLFQKTPQENS